MQLSSNQIETAPNDQVGTPSVALQPEAAPVSMPVGNLAEQRLSKLASALNVGQEGFGHFADAQQARYAAQQEEAGFRDQALDPATAPVFTPSQSAYYKNARVHLYAEKTGADLELQIRNIADALMKDPNKLQNTDLDALKNQLYKNNIAGITNPVVAKTLYGHMTNVFGDVFSKLADAQRGILVQQTQNDLISTAIAKISANPDKILENAESMQSEYVRPGGLSRAQYGSLVTNSLARLFDTDYERSKTYFTDRTDEDGKPISPLLQVGADGTSFMDRLAKDNPEAAQALYAHFPAEFERERRAQNFEESQNEKTYADNVALAHEAIMNGQRVDYTAPEVQSMPARYRVEIERFQLEWDKKNANDTTAQYFLNNPQARAAIPKEALPAVEKAVYDQGAAIFQNGTDQQGRLRFVSQAIQYNDDWSHNTELPNTIKKNVAGIRGIAAPKVGDPIDPTLLHAIDLHLAMRNRADLINKIPQVFSKEDNQFLETIESRMGNPDPAGIAPIATGNYVDAIAYAQNLYSEKGDQRVQDNGHKVPGIAEAAAKKLSVPGVITLGSNLDDESQRVLQDRMKEIGYEALRDPANGDADIQRKMQDTARNEFLFMPDVNYTWGTKQARVFYPFEPSPAQRAQDPNVDIFAGPGGRQNLQVAIEGVENYFNNNMKTLGHEGVHFIQDPTNKNQWFMEDGGKNRLNVFGTAGGVITPFAVVQMYERLQNIGANTGAPESHGLIYEGWHWPEQAAKWLVDQFVHTNVPAQKDQYKKLFDQLTADSSDPHVQALRKNFQTDSSQDAQSVQGVQLPAPPSGVPAGNGTFRGFKPLPYPGVTSKGLPKGVPDPTTGVGLTQAQQDNARSQATLPAGVRTAAPPGAPPGMTLQSAIPPPLPTGP